jgi:hypothetical protein
MLVEEVHRPHFAGSVNPYPTMEIVMSQSQKSDNWKSLLCGWCVTGRFGLFEIKVPAGARVPPPHSHTDNEECVYGWTA